MVDTCPFCNSALSQDVTKEGGNFYQYFCPVCADVRYDDFSAYNFPNNLTVNEKIMISYYLRTTKKELKAEPLRYENYQKKISSISLPSLLGKIDKVIEDIHSKTEFWGQEIILNTKTDYILFFCKDSAELKEILNYLQSNKYISYIENPDKKWIYSIRITPAGIKKIEESGKNPKSDKCFVAMQFNDDMQKIYSDVINPAIKQGAGYKAMKIDNKEHVNYITDEIIKEIRRSKFMIADLTGSRSGVYYEAGFAFGLGLPVIFTCRKDWENNIEEKCGCIRDGVHFDIKQRNMIFWEEDKPEEFKKALINRIGAVVGLNT